MNEVYKVTVLNKILTGTSKEIYVLANHVGSAAAKGLCIARKQWREDLETKRHIAALYVDCSEYICTLRK